jgi:thiol-disulfide isomerase/thioredoxin
MGMRRLRNTILVALAFLLPVLAKPAAHPLSADDVTLLLIGGGTSDRLVTLIEERGVDFQLTPELEKKFRDNGATDSVIEALKKAGEKLAPPAEPQPGERAATIEEKINAAIPSSSPSNDDPLAPTFSLQDLTGKPLNLADYKGKVVLLNFWASWCGPCRSEIPKLVELQHTYGRQGFQVIGVAVDDSTRSVKKFYEDYMVNYPVAMCDSRVRSLYGGLRGLPTTLLIGRDGRIRSRIAGAPRNFDWFDQSVQRLLSFPAGEGKTAVAESGAAHTAVPGSVTAAPVARTTASGAPASPGAPTAATPDLPDPSSEKIQQIIQAFAAKETLFKQARDNYAFHQSNKVEQLGPDNEIVGTFQQDWDILYDDKGARIEKVTYAPPDTLKGLLITKEDYENFRSIQPFVLTSDRLPEFEVKYLGHVKVDEITAYVFSVRPKEIKKGSLYFQGVVWVDDQDLQIVKSEGKTIPEPKTKQGENLFPRFTTYREQIDGKFWFPTFTMADDTLYFASGPIHMKEVIRYSDYKQFKSKVRILTATPVDQPTGQPTKPH